MLKKIAIIGAGPAGASAAIFLAKKGFEVTLLDRIGPGGKKLKIGESLPPDTHKLLCELDVWDTFRSAGHLKCFGNKSLWGSRKLTYTDYIHHPVGHGWHIDRTGFENMLIEKAKEFGTDIRANTTIVDAVFKDGSWIIVLKDGTGSRFNRRYDFLVDASGRNSWLARKQGVERLYEDRQLALIAFLKIDRALEDTSSLIETVEQGWWYSTKIPGEKLATAFLCKPGKAEREYWLTEKGWKDLVAHTHFTSRRLQDTGATLLAKPYFVAAESSILEQTYGEGWVAVGDAAMAYDPIASHGILMAMVSARDAANALEQYIQGRKDAFEAYDTVLWVAFQHYTRQRMRFYQAEKRFAGSAYWK